MGNQHNITLETDLLREDTLCRYESYMDRKGFEFGFINYSYIDEDEVKTYLYLQSTRNEQNNIEKAIQKENKNNKNNTLNKTSFKLLWKIYIRLNRNCLSI